MSRESLNRSYRFSHLHCDANLLLCVPLQTRLTNLPRSFTSPCESHNVRDINRWHFSPGQNHEVGQVSTL